MKNTVKYQNTLQKKKPLFLLVLLCLLFSKSGWTQVYPVQANTHLIPPYSLKLSDYATAQSDKLILNLLLTDVNEFNRRVRLRLTIKGNGLHIRSRDIVVGARPIYLNGGVPLRLTNIDLRPYFQLRNLQGISPQQYSSPLPDGRYQFCIEVFDWASGQRLSNPNLGCAQVYLIINDPPILNLPRKGELVEATNPQNIVFNWTPRHLNATNVRYIFEIRELWNTQTAPEAAFLASPVLYSTTTHSNTLLYGPGQTGLLENKTYGWRVRAVVGNGISQTSVFRNNGYSEIFYFTYTADCKPPQFAIAKSLSSSSEKISWQPNVDHKGYKVQYRKKDTQGAVWFEANAINPHVTLYNLEPGTTYEFRVGGQCLSPVANQDPGYTYAAIQTFTTPSEEADTYYNCGIAPKVEISNKEPLPNLGINEVFTAGDFPVKVKKISGKNGVFSGEGFIVVPYLSMIKIPVEFKNIKINTDYQMYAGTVLTTYDPTWSNVMDVGDIFGDGPGGGQEVTIDFPLKSLPEGIQIAQDGNIVLVGEEGQTQELPGGKDYVITDSQGNQFAVDEDGNITQLGVVAEGGKPTPENTNGVSSEGEATDITAEGIRVTFTKANDNKYGFDAYNPAYPNTQALYEKLGSDYYIPYKAVKNGGVDYIIANINITDNSIVADSLVFKTQDGTAIEVIEKNGTQWKLKLKGYQKDAVKDILATIKQGDKYNVAGVFKLYHLEEKTVDIVLVNTNQANKQVIEDKLNEVYKQAVVKVNIVQEITDFTIHAPNGTIDNGKSGFAANYTKQQQEINSALRNRQDYDSHAYYLITTDLIPTEPEKGFMPLGRQFGYIFCRTANCIPHTIAHEIGHGTFELKHPFSEHSYGWTPGSTNWLMDYAEGEHLPYIQWQAIHNPNIHIGIFDSDSEGEYTSEENNNSDAATDEQEEAITLKEYNDLLYQLILALKSQEGKAFLKCKECKTPPPEINQIPDASQSLDGRGVVFVEFGNIDSDIYKKFKCILGSIKADGEISLKKVNRQEFLSENKMNVETDYYSKDFTKLSSLFTTSNKNEFLLVTQTNGHLLECTTPLTFEEDYCSNKEVSDQEIINLTQELEQCDPVDISNIHSILKSLQGQMRKKQTIQWGVNGKVYKLNKFNQVKEVENALTDNQIENGEWTDERIDQIFRLYRNENGILQFKAVGIRSDLPIVAGKEADLEALSRNMKVKGNAFLANFQVKNIDDTPEKKGITLDSKDFADGKQIMIREDVSFFKIIFEGAGKMGVLLKTGKIEKSTYLESTEPTEIVHAPGLVTGSVEAATRAVTDITGVVVLVYDLSVDAKAREKTWVGLKRVKDQIIDNPSTLFPLLTDIILEEVTGNTKKDWSEALKATTDSGKKSHILTKGSVSTAMSVFSGGKLILQLPKIADELAVKLLDAKLWNKFKKAEGFTQDMLQGFKKNLDELLETIPEAAESLLKIADFTSAEELAELVRKMNKLKEVPGLNKVIADMGKYWTTFKGGQFQLDYAEKLFNIGKKISFEVSDLSDNLKRVYDITFEEIIDELPKIKKLELKNWNNFYPETIKSQLIKDLVKMEELGDIQWIFNKTDNIPDMSALKTKVLNALKDAKGNPIDELEDLFDNPTSLNNVKKVFGEDVNSPNDLLVKLSSNDVFSKIFKVVENVQEIKE